MKKYRPCGHERAYFANDPKQEARRFIAECWYRFSGRVDIPGKYYSLCGPMAHQGVLQEGSELCQLEKAGLYRPAQFNGVEHRVAVHRANAKAVVARYAANARPTLHCGDIIDVLHQHLHRGKLAASIVNVDSINEPHAAATLLWRTMNVLNHVDGPMMIMWSVISGRRVPRHVIYPWDDRDIDILNGGVVGQKGRVVSFIKDILLSLPAFCEAYRHGWAMFPDSTKTFTSCRYEGSQATQMTMYAFVRRRKACKDNCRC